MKDCDSVKTPVIHILMTEIDSTSAKCGIRAFFCFESGCGVIEDKLQVALNWNMSLMRRRRRMRFITALKTGTETKRGLQ